MEIGNQIKYFRLRKGVTQETLAAHLGVTPQAVSKWERNAASPDIALLPAISAYFGITIDDLFALSDDTRMERIQNMIWDVRFLNPSDADNARQFLLEKAQREPLNGKPHALLAELENHIAKAHHDLAAEYAKEALRRDHTIKDAHSNLCEAMRGDCGDWCVTNLYELIEYYKAFVELHPDYISGYLWLIDQLIVVNRLKEAELYCDRVAKLDKSFRTPLYYGLISMARGDNETADRYFDQMCRDHGGDWATWMSMGDIHARRGRYDASKECYRKYLELQKPPRYTDGCTAIAQICEIQGDYAGAITAIREEIAILESDWNTTSGETVDQHLRNIARLEQKLHK